MADQIIDIPGVGQVAFPEGMSDFDITKAIRTKILPQAQTKAPDTKTGMQDSFLGGALMNFGDEVKAGIRATFGPDLINRYRELDKKFGLPGTAEPSKEADWKARYDEELIRARESAKKFGQENPALDTVSNVVGNVAGSAALLALPGGSSLAAMGPRVGVNALKGATAGAILGGAAGYGAGEGEGNRIDNALVGGGVGLVTGGALPVVGAGARQVYERAAPSVLRKTAGVAEKFVKRGNPNSLSAAAPDGTAGVALDSPATRLADAARNKALSIEDEAAIRRLAITMSGRHGPDAVQNRLNVLGKGAFIGDANKGTERLAYVTQANSDDAAESMMGNYLTRNSATGTRFKEVVPEAPAASSAEKFLKAYTTAEGQKIYDPVLRAGGGKLNVTPELDDLTKRPAIKEAFETVKAWEAEHGRAFTEAERYHRVKRALNANAQAKIDRGVAIDRDLVGGTADDWERALWAGNPEIKAADQTYAKVASLPEVFERGQNFAARGRGEAARNASPDALKSDLPQFTPDQRNVLAAGARSDMRRIASEGPDQTRALAKRLTDGDDMVARMQEILGPEVAERIVAAGNAERTFAEKFGNVMRGSPTAERNATLMRDQGIGPPMSGDIMSVLRWARDSVDKLNTPSESVRRKLGDLLTNPDSAANAETIALVREYLSRRPATNALRAYAPGAAGNQASGP
jgi:hypothetical protein